MRPESLIYTPKWDDDKHPWSFLMTLFPPPPPPLSPGLASLQCILCLWPSQNSFWNLWRFQGDLLNTLRVKFRKKSLIKISLHANLSCCFLSHRRRSKEYLHGFWITTASSCSYLVSQSSFLSSTEAKMRLVHYISFYPVFPHALLYKCNNSLCERDLKLKFVSVWV